jgi:hypothetical protein
VMISLTKRCVAEKVRGERSILAETNDVVRILQACGERILAETVSTLIENSPIVLFSFHGSMTIMDSAMSTPTMRFRTRSSPGLGSRPSPSSGFEVDCRIRTVADNVILNEPPGLIRI